MFSNASKQTIFTVAASRFWRGQIAARALCDERSVERAYKTLPVRSTTMQRIAVAAADLGLPEPPSGTPITRKRPTREQR